MNDQSRFSKPEERIGTEAVLIHGGHAIYGSSTDYSVCKTHDRVTIVRADGESVTVVVPSGWWRDEQLQMF
jgi:hypothetical protein